MAVSGQDPARVREVLLSPGFGAGWATWFGSSEAGKFAAEYRPIIDFLTSGGSFVETTNDCDPERPWEQFAEPGASVLKQFVDDYRDRFAAETPFLGGAADLVVRTVTGPYRIFEDAGYESLIEASQMVWW